MPLTLSDALFFCVVAAKMDRKINSVYKQMVPLAEAEFADHLKSEGLK